ncbi:hypothetical protein HYALB_00010016 [Hymenoscyphus albidus]|uniref:40S ribosomal protein S12 n=2 Tax=Helotiales TaxID=5178 RepID=A0A9N9LPB9_9HELO|nr:hypothetical protein HYALB_00010016 [Hymenoscyphus albidus]
MSSVAQLSIALTSSRDAIEASIRGCGCSCRQCSFQSLGAIVANREDADLLPLPAMKDSRESVPWLRHTYLVEVRDGRWVRGWWMECVKFFTMQNRKIFCRIWLCRTDPPASPASPSVGLSDHYLGARHTEIAESPEITPVQSTRISTNTSYNNNLFFEDRKSSNTVKMSDAEDNASNAPDVAEAEEVEVSGDATSKGQMSVLDALKGVLKLALMHDGLARGLREASKALDRRQAHMCVLNEACEEEAYKKLVVALCSEHKIPLIKVPDGKQLGEWAGLCVLDREGNARKVVNCSCVVVKDWGEESQERSILLNYFQTEQ